MSVLQEVRRSSGRLEQFRSPRSPGRPRYFAGLDGIRAIAVIAVMAYHFGLPHSAGGFLGVDLFFVLSGYLITGQLITRWVYGTRVSGASFAAFWAARARRLFPSLAVMLAATTAVVVVADRGQLSLYRGDVAAAATYTSNWWYIFHERSYFVAAGRPPLLQHLWSLAVEEQFYLIWPVVILLIILLMRRGRARQVAVFAVAVILMLASAAVMGIGSAVDRVPQLGDPSRWYFGTDAHASGLLAGAALAALRGGDGLGSSLSVPPRPATTRQTMMGTAAMVGVLTILSQVGEFNTGLYRVGFLGFALLATMLVAVAVRPGPLARLLGWAPLVAVGKRSYAMYLWHWPVAAMTRPGVDLTWPPWAVLTLRIAATLALTEVSYRLVEQPIRRLGWRGYWRRITGWQAGRLPGTMLPGLVAAGLVVAAFWPSPGQDAARHQQGYAAGATYVHCPTGPDGTAQLPADAPAGAHCANLPAPHSTPEPAPGHQATPRGHDPAPTGPGQSTTVPGRSTTGNAERTLAHQQLIVYGDSVPLGAISALSGAFATVTNHAAEGIQAWTLLPRMIANGHAGKLTSATVLLHTGDNGLINADQLSRALQAASGARRIIVATPHVPDSWQAPNVATIERVVPRFSNAVILDWDQHMTDDHDWVYPDGIHLTPTGAAAYSRLVTQAATSKH